MSASRKSLIFMPHYLQSSLCRFAVTTLRFAVYNISTVKMRHGALFLKEVNENTLPFS
jgi:hypothetical protein